MTSWKKLNSDITWITLMSVIALLIHLLTYKGLGFHRDEFLYLALGRHLATGYWSNPPLIGLISFIEQHLPGNSLFTTRLLPAIAGGLLVFLTGLIARELGGKRFAQIFAGIALITTILFLRAYSMLQPVPFDILFWTLILYYLLRYVNTEKPVYIILTGVFFGLGLLNKYMLVFLILGIMLAVLPTKYRQLWKNKYTWLAACITLIVLLPNIIWQIRHNLPVVYHMNELVRTQLVHVNRLNIVIDQVVMFVASSFVWISGFFWLLSKKNQKYRVFGFIYIAVLFLLVLFRGKSYYTAGLYPFMFAAGAVACETWYTSRLARTVLTSLIILVNLPLVPGGIPLFSAKTLSEYFEGMYNTTKIDALLRWEDGKVHPLPQDYADMLGWDELADVVYKACDTIKDKNSIIIYAENYGQAGAIDQFKKDRNFPDAVSFSDSYIEWMPDSISDSKNTLIYVNGELGRDVDSIFSKIDTVGSITNPLAREYGTTVYLCRQPRADFRKFMKERVREVKLSLGQR